MIDGIYEFDPDDAFRFASTVGIQARKSRNQLLFKQCPYCRGGKSHDKETFAISLKDGRFNCKRSSCGITGNMYTLAKDFKFELSEEYTRYLNRTTGSYKRFRDSRKQIETKTGAIGYMQKRGISEEIAKRYELTTKKDDDSVLVFPFRDERGELRFIKYRKMDFEKGKTEGSKEWCEANCMPILFGMNQCNPENKTIVITEGQIDSLSVAEAGIENAVSVPTGAKGFTWVPYCWDFVEQFDRIIVFGDHEDGNITLLDEIAKRFRRKQILHVREEDYMDCKDANEILQKYGRGKVRSCVENAIQIPLNQIIDLADVEDVNPFDIPKLETGIHKIDSTLYGGIPFGGVTLISGKTGDGKSTFADQIILNAVRQGYKSFIYSGELPNHLIKSWLMLQTAGPEFCREERNQFGQKVYRLTEGVKSRINDWVRGKLFLYDNSVIYADERAELLELIEKTIVQYGVKVILIDNLMTAVGMDEHRYSDKYEHQGRFVNSLTRIAMEYNALILLVAHKRKNNFGDNENDEVLGSSNIANLIMLNLVYEKDRRQESKRELKDSQRYLKITKNRLFGITNEKGIVLEYDEASKRIYENGGQNHLNDRFGWETGEEANGFVNAEDTSDFDKIPF